MFIQIDKDEALKASKFLKHQFFISISDLKLFFSNFPSIRYIPLGKVFQENEPLGGIEEFFKSYEDYQERILKDENRSYNDLRIALSGAFSLFDEAFGFQLLNGDKRIYKPILPVMQMQMLSFMIGIDHKIHFTLGKEVLFLGLQVLFPQLFIDNHQQIQNGLIEKNSPNAPLFKAFASFLRDHTSTLRFTLDGKKVMSTIRISPDLFSKIQNLKKFQSLGFTL